MAASQVELVANPSSDVSTYRWVVDTVGHLNRKNKMTSLPFWMPNYITKEHQFRLILIRGVVLREHARDDPIGVMLELIPPPTGTDVAFPGGCVVTASLVNRVHDDGTHNIEATETVEIAPDNLQVFFPELIPASALQDPEFAEGEGPTLLIEVTIQTGVNVTFERVNQTVTSVWSRISSSVSKLVERAAHALGETREEYGVCEAAQEHRKLPWEDVPKGWEEKEDEWRHLVTKLIVEDEGTFRYGPNRGFSKDEQALLVQCGLNQRSIADARAIFDYNRDVHEGLLAVPEIRQQRYNLVPGKLKDEVFWANYFWKVAVLGYCTNDEQVRLLLTVLNAPPAVQPRDISSIRLVDEETVLFHVSDAQEAADMLVEYLTDDAPDGDMLLEAAAEACEGHARQLEGYFKRTDLSESTLKVIGVLLKRLRDRLTAYRERNVNRGLLGENGVMLPTRDLSRENYDCQVSVKSIQPHEEHLVARASSPLKQPHKEGEADKPEDIVSSSIVESVVKEAERIGHTLGVKQTGATIGNQSGVRVTSGLEFPKMPWEEEDEVDE
ncbi:BSD domain containing protein, putative [Trypanosoma equiperdum]|uniref:BSD domain containing protein, putative n=1 Tax=Trypanosoma equiperdum TaxID=5694 RepID=A0A1G4IC92_TRYEQ|nr:BSD domain containing protein, putative [Trypanosoma equiperdum]